MIRDWIWGLLLSAAIVGAMMAAEYPGSKESLRVEGFEGFRVSAVEGAERAPAQVRAFRKDHPCPATGKNTGACAGWVVDHIIPLCWGGADAPANMQWQEQAASFIKDKFEREACAMKKKFGGV
jgi:hypothetical protein